MESKASIMALMVTTSMRGVIRVVPEEDWGAGQYLGEPSWCLGVIISYIHSTNINTRLLTPEGSK